MDRPRIIVTDKLSEQGIKKMEEEADVDIALALSEEELMERIPQYDALVIRSGTKVTRKVVESAANLKVIGRAGVGVDNIDMEAATERGIMVVNTPEGNTVSAAEHTIAMLLSLSRNIPQADHSLKSKKWERSQFMGVEVGNKTLGIIGLGRIGFEVARMAQGLGMRTIGYDPLISDERAKEMGVTSSSVDEILKTADYLSVHTHLTEETKHMISHEQFKKMKPGVRVINCARGGIIDEEALAKAIKEGIVAGAALDVFENEPPYDSDLLKMNNVIVTPHLGASTKEAQVNVAVMVADQVLKALKGEPVKNALNMF